MRLAKELTGKLLRLILRGSLLVLCAIPLLSNTVALAQTDRMPIAATETVQTLYTVHQALLGAGLPGATTSPTAERFFTPELASSLAGLKGDFDPLTGAANGPIDAFQSKPGAAGNGQPVIMVAVKSAGTVRIVRLQMTAGDEPRVSNIAGKGWTIAGLLAASSGSGSGTAASDNPREKPADLFRQSSEQPKTGEGIGDVPHETAQTTEPPVNVETGPVRQSLGGSLEEGWTILNEDNSSYAFEADELLIVATGANASFTNPTAANLFQRTLPVPDVDFDLMLAGRLELKTGFEGVWLGLRASERDYLAARLYIGTGGCGPAIGLDLINSRDRDAAEKPAVTIFNRNLFDGPFADDMCTKGRPYGDAVLAALQNDGFTLTLSRRGYAYSVAVEMTLPAAEGQDGGPARYESQIVTRLKPFGHAAFLLDQDRNAKKGESVAHFTAFEFLPVE